MKSYYTLALLFVCLLRPIMARYNMDRLMHAGIPECLADHSVSAADLQATTNRPIDKVDVHVKCAVKCILMKMGIVNDFGQLQSEDLFGIFDDPILHNKVTGNR
ncbi:hypothetical protein ACLKA6_006792 [Drosophila palustris]